MHSSTSLSPHAAPLSPSVSPRIQALSARIPAHGQCSLSDWGILEVQGSDASDFLHKQLTQDVNLMPTGHARLAAWCSAKGRIMVSVLLIKRSTDSLWLLMPHSSLPAVSKRLSMFILRAQVRLQDVTALWRVQGLWGETAVAALPGLDAHTPWQCQIAAAHDGALPAEAVTVSLYPGLQHARALRIEPASSPNSPSASPDAALDFWRVLAVCSSVAWVGAPEAEQFVPQMLNYESIGGVNFKKGCYPGQEVVARSQFRGAIKRRTYWVSAEASVKPGQEVFSASDAEQSCGVVISSAALDGVSVALICAQTDSAHSPWHAGSAQGPALHLEPLPYALLTDI